MEPYYIVSEEELKFFQVWQLFLQVQEREKAHCVLELDTNQTGAVCFKSLGYTPNFEEYGSVYSLEWSNLDNAIDLMTRYLAAQ